MKKLLVSLSILTTSCQLVIDADVPYEGDRIVVNAIQRPDSVWAVDVALTRYILDDAWEHYGVVDGANVVIHKPDGTAEILVDTGNGLYVGSSYPEIGKEYKVTVDAPGVGYSEGAMKMPPLVKIIDVKWDSSRVTNDGPGCNCTRANVPFTITFADPAGESNYYDVTVYIYTTRTYNRYPDGQLVTDTTAGFQAVYVRDPGLAGEHESEFSDNTFDGKTRTVPMIAELINWNGGEMLKVEVRLTTSYEDFYKYNETLELQYEVMGDPFAQPVQVFSNMSNGFGIFTGTSTDVVEFKVQE